MLTRSFLPPESRTGLLAYSPMFHSRLWVENPKYAPSMFQPVKTTEGTEVPWLDGNEKFDRPFFVQFCANDPEILLAAAKRVASHCDAVDLNLGCPQGIAKKGHYGSFLQEDQDLIYRLVNILHKELPIPVTAKMRILETKEKTLDYAKNLLSAGASILTVHGRQRFMKGHYTGIADWSVIRYLRENLPPETVIFANGNILQHSDIKRCLDATGADGVMSAEGNLHDPAIFATPPPIGSEGREYWRGKDGRGGWRIDAVVRRYLDIVYKYVIGQEPPTRKPLFITSDPPDVTEEPESTAQEETQNDDEGPQRKKSKKEKKMARVRDKKDENIHKGPNFHPMRAHMFSICRNLIGVHTQIRDTLARTRVGDMEGYENVLKMIETVTKDALIAYEKETEAEPAKAEEENEVVDDSQSSEGARLRCKRPFWVCQPYLRPFANEMIEKGHLKVKGEDKQPSKDTGVKISKEEETTNKVVEAQVDAALSG
jgi:tRNA-dihydrouridine synthase 1